MSMQSSASGHKPRRLWLRVLAPGVAATLMAGLAMAAYVRGTWADSEPLMPTDVSSGALCHLYQMPGEGKQVRCAMLVPYSLDLVWEAVTDYDHYGDICSYVHAGDITHDPNGTCHLEATAQSGLPGDGQKGTGPVILGVLSPFLRREMPFTAEIRHEQHLNQYRTTWDEPSGDVLVNRGHWILTPRGPAETLVELTLEVEVRGVPTFILRNLSMQRLPEVVRAVEQRLRTNGAGRKW